MIDSNSLEEDYESHILSDNRKVLSNAHGVRSSSSGPAGATDGLNEIRRQIENSNKFKRANGGGSDGVNLISTGGNLIMHNNMTS